MNTSILTSTKLLTAVHSEPTEMCTLPILMNTDLVQYPYEPSPHDAVLPPQLDYRVIKTGEKLESSWICIQCGYKSGVIDEVINHIENKHSSAEPAM